MPPNPAQPDPAQPDPAQPDPAHPYVARRPGSLRGLIVDWGGVLTAPIDEAMAAWARHEGIDLTTYAAVLRPWFEAVESPIHDLERGRMAPAEFERRLSESFREHGVQVGAEGLLSRMLAGLSDLSDDMVNLVRRARAQGIRTALLSNSWGEHYPEHLWVGAFDAVVISGRVGLRKPEVEIFRHTAGLLNLAPEECVMVDDLVANVSGAVAAGMVGVRHVSQEETAEELEALFDLSLH